MTDNNNGIKYKESCKMMFEMISRRLRFKRDFLGKKNRDIYPDDENLISKIINNRRNDKKNKYLIPSETTRAEKEKNYIPTIVSNLEFESACDLLWGGYNEIEAYSGRLFHLLVSDALKYENGDVQSELYDVLTNYIPFAKLRFCASMTGKYDLLARSLIEDRNFVDGMDFFEILDHAIVHLYAQIKSSFPEILKNHLYKRENTLKLDRYFSSFVRENLLPFCCENLEKDTIGQLANKVLYWTKDQVLARFQSEMQSSPETVEYPLNESGYMYCDYIRDLENAGLEYVDNLSGIQEKFCSDEDIFILHSTWTPEMCI